jgi:hypothetical protein
MLLGLPAAWLHQLMIWQHVQQLLRARQQLMH